VFAETITQPSEEWDDWSTKLRMSSDPPASLAASIAGEDGSGLVTMVNVWDAPGAVSDFSVERVLPLIQAEGEPKHKPPRHGEPVAIYLRPESWLPRSHADDGVPFLRCP
jgi:hypothetical protein